MPYTAANDAYKYYPIDKTTFGTRTQTIVPAAAELNPYPKAVMLVAAGDITVVALNDLDATTRTFTACPVGFVVPLFVRRVTACANGCIGIME